MNVEERNIARSENAKDKDVWRGHAKLARKRSRSDPDFSAKQKEKQKERLSSCSFAAGAQATSCNSFFTQDPSTSPYMKDRVLTENAKYLTPEQMHALEIDIFKPLDFYEILFDRMKARDNGEEEDGQQFTVMNWQDFKTLMMQP